MGIIRKTFTFWLIIGIIAALAVTLFMPSLKRKAVKKLPGRAEAMKLIQQAKNAISKPSVNPAAPAVEKTSVKPSVEPEPKKTVFKEDSIAKRDEKLFARQCSILDDLL